MSGEVERLRILQSLLELDGPLEKILSELTSLGWDSEEELVTLQPQHVMEILSRFKSGVLDAKDVERWANVVESREDVRLDPESRGVLKAAIFELANPVLQGPITVENTERVIERLRVAGRRKDPSANSE